MNARIVCVIFISSFSNTLYCTSNYEQSFSQGCTYFNENNHALAIIEFEKALQLNPRLYQAYYNLGLIYEHKKDIAKAIDYFIKALEINPDYIRPHGNLANIYYTQGNHVAAKKHYLKVIAFDAKNSSAYHNLGKIYFEETALDQCVYYLTQATQLDPNNVHILLDLANARNILNETEEALRLYFVIDSIIPNNQSIIYNIAYTLKKLGRLKEAMPYYQKVLSINPEHADAHFSYGLALLLTGDWEHGWSEYEWRWIKDKKSTFPHYDKPMWDGSELNGKTIYLRAEQGLGDSFQFIRYAKVAKEMGGKTVVAVQPNLIRYFKLCPYIDVIISTHEAPPHFDVYAALVSCPMILKTRLDNVPTPIPYLPADETLVEQWRIKLAQDKKFKIGICWQGNPNYSTHFLRMAVAAKSLNVNLFVPLFDIPDTSFYCLQLKTGTEQLKTLSPRAQKQLTVFDDTFDVHNGNFMDSAAVIKNLDLVITVDTSVAHFSAGLGTPTWILIPEPPDWRWMLNCTDTPWYPNMRLFRQSKPGDWQSVMDTIAAELITLLDMRS